MFPRIFTTHFDIGTTAAAARENLDFFLHATHVANMISNFAFYLILLD